MGKVDSGELNWYQPSFDSLKIFLLYNLALGGPHWSLWMEHSTLERLAQQIHVNKHETIQSASGP